MVHQITANRAKNRCACQRGASAGVARNTRENGRLLSGKCRQKIMTIFSVVLQILLPRPWCALSEGFTHTHTHTLLSISLFLCSPFLLLNFVFHYRVSVGVCVYAVTFFHARLASPYRFRDFIFLEGYVPSFCADFYPMYSLWDTQVGPVS